MSYQTVHECPIKNCYWSVTVDSFSRNVPVAQIFLEMRRYDNSIEETLREHLLSHSRWKLNRKIRKALKEKK